MSTERHRRLRDSVVWQVFGRSPRPYPVRLLLARLLVLPVLGTGTAVIAVGLERTVQATLEDGSLGPPLVMLGLGIAMMEFRIAAQSPVTGFMFRSLEVWTMEAMLDAADRVKTIDPLLRPSYHADAETSRLGARRGVSLAIELASNMLEAMLSLGVLTAALSTINPWVLLLIGLYVVLAVVVERRFAREDVAIDVRGVQSLRRHDYLQRIPYSPSTAQEPRLFNLVPWIKSEALISLNSHHSARADHDLRSFRARSVVATAAIAISVGAVVLATQDGAEEATALILVLPAVAAAQSFGRSIAQAVAQGTQARTWLRSFLDFTSDDKREGQLGVDAAKMQSGSLVLKNVHYAYPGGVNALAGIDLVIEPGNNYAIVGANGSGKSTLLRVLLRLVEPTQGVVEMNGVDVRDIHMLEYRALFSAVFQDFVRYQMTLEENVRIGRDFLSQRSVVDAIEAFGLDSSQESLDTVLAIQIVQPDSNRRSRELSGGEWQRVALARAFANPSAAIIVLDEPSSALDPLADGDLSRTLERLLIEKTAVIVSHRLGLTAKADQIVVMDNGRIVETGTHHELRANQGLYEEMWLAQQAVEQSGHS